MKATIQSHVKKLQECIKESQPNLIVYGSHFHSDLMECIKNEIEALNTPLCDLGEWYFEGVNHIHETT